MKTFHLDIIGTHCALRVDTSSSAIDEDFSRIEQYMKDFEARFSRFIVGNWLHRLNTSRSGILDHDAKEMLSFALELARKTDGYFDPTIGKYLRDLGYGNPDTALQSGENVFDQIFASQSAYGDYRDIHIEEDHITLSRSVELEFGGVGKGYLLDILTNILDPYPRYLINFGGDLSGRGGWKVGLESPFAPDEIIGVHVLDGHFLACSAGTKRKWGNHHHLIDPKTGSSATDVDATYIEGSSGMCVDGYATALSVMPWETACQTLEKTPEISGVLVRHDGSLYQKEGSLSEVFR